MKLDSSLRFEVKADAFYRETGQLAPGKDAAALSAAAEDRQQQWDDWNKAYGKVIDRVFTAVETLTQGTEK